MKILSPKEYETDHYPTMEDLHNAIDYISNNLEDLVKNGDVIGATSCGSFFFPEKQSNILSDIDWIIVFSSLEKQLSSTKFQGILSYFQEKNIPFFNPVLSIEAIENKNHIIAPIMHGIRQATERIIQGEDLVILLESHGVKKNDIEIISRLFSTFTRYFFEYLFYNNEKNVNDIVKNIQTGLGFYTDTYRTMLVLQCQPDDFATTLDMVTYLNKYKQYLSPESISFVEEIERFKSIYKSMIFKKVPLGEYVDFINECRGLAFKIAMFCKENILIFSQLFKNNSKL